MSILSLVLYVFALVFFILATAGVPSQPRFNLLPAGLACAMAGFLLAGVSLGSHV